MRARSRRGRCGGWCGVNGKEKADYDLGGERGDGSGRGEHGPWKDRGFTVAVLLVVSVQLAVNLFVVRRFGGEFRASSSSSSPPPPPPPGNTPAGPDSRIPLFHDLLATSIPVNSFEGVYFSPGAFSVLETDANQALDLPPVRARENYARIDFNPQELEDITGSTDDGNRLSAKGKLRWRPDTGSVGSSGASAGASHATLMFPPAAVGASAFAASFLGRFHFEAGQHRFVIASSGGFRLFVDGVIVIDELSIVSNSMREPFVGSRLLSIPIAGMREIWLEFEQYPAITSHAHWKAFAASASISAPDWKQTAEIMLGAHLHLHWLRDDFGLKIYMYDLPARFNNDVRASNEKCKKGHMFGSEVAVHHALAESSARTLDPREADLFYVPVYTACKYLGAPYFGVDPWFGKRMTKNAIKYAKKEFPFWRRHNGADHVFAMTYDYGACFEYKYSKANPAGVLRELNNAILLSIISDASVSCFRPAIDVPIPTYIAPTNKLLAPLLQPTALLGSGIQSTFGLAGTIFGSATERRDWFVYFQGQKEWAIDHDPEYSNGIRKLLFTQYANDPLFHLGEGKTPQYIDNLRRSVFCLCPRGFAVWSPRPYESVVSGCIPVIIADNMHLPFSFEGSGLDWREFSVMIPESRVRAGGASGTQLKNILLAMSPGAILAKQRALRSVRDKMIFLPPQNGGGEAVLAGSTGQRRSATAVPPRGDAFEMVLLALREKARAAKWVRSNVGSGFWA